MVSGRGGGVMERGGDEEESDTTYAALLHGSLVLIVHVQ